MIGRALQIHSHFRGPFLSLRSLGVTFRPLLLTILAGILCSGQLVHGADNQEGHADAAKANHDHIVKPDAEAEKHSAMEEVLDNPAGEWEFFKTFGVVWHLPSIPLPGGRRLQITKYMVVELLAAILIAALYIPLARRVRRGEAPHGWGDNFREVLLTFIRDEVAKPGIGEHDADKYVPFLWTLFLFILFNNLFGMMPFGASPTASLFVTGALALIVFFAIHGCAVAEMGAWHYLQTLWPDLEAPFGLGYALKPLIFVLDVVGVLVRNAVLAVRLFANLFAGHMVSGTILLFIVIATNPSIGLGLWTTITIGSVFGVVALSMLELFVAFLQAYIFVFLTALFMGMALHPQH
jgi:F-type H+-transporting ATPase subunit a